MRREGLGFRRFSLGVGFRVQAFGRFISGLAFRDFKDVQSLLACVPWGFVFAGELSSRGLGAYFQNGLTALGMFRAWGLY